MAVRIPYRTGIALGALAWILLGYARSIYFYDMIVSGQFVKVILEATHRGRVDSRLQEATISLLPVAALIFLAAIYLEAAGKAGIVTRRIVSGLAAVLMLAATVAIAAIPQYGDGFTWFMWAVGLLQFLAWIPLMAVFAVSRAPLRSRVTEFAAWLLGGATVLTLSVYLGAHVLKAAFQWKYAVAILTQVSAWTLIVLFSIAAKRETAIQRKGALI